MAQGKIENPYEGVEEGIEYVREKPIDGMGLDALRACAYQDGFKAQRAIALAVWGDFVVSGWARPDDALKDAFGFTSEEQQQAIAQAEKREKAYQDGD